MKIFLTASLFLCVSLQIFCVGDCCAQSITWQKMYGADETDDLGYDVCQSSDGNFFVVGVSGITAQYIRMLVVKINQYGDTIWSKEYPIGEYAYAVVATNDGGCVLTGYPSDSAFVIKLSSNGEVVWQRVYPFGGVFFDLQKTPDGGYIACGNPFDGSILMKIDSMGILNGIETMLR